MELLLVADRDALLSRCSGLAPGRSLTLAQDEIDAALPAAERPPEWTALSELFALLSVDPDLRLAEDRRTGAVTVTRFAEAMPAPAPTRMVATMAIRRHG